MDHRRTPPPARLETIRVVLVEPGALVGLGIRRALDDEPDMEVVAEVRTFAVRQGWLPLDEPDHEAVAHSDDEAVAHSDDEAVADSSDGAPQPASATPGGIA